MLFWGTESIIVIIIIIIIIVNIIIIIILYNLTFCKKDSCAVKYGYPRPRSAV